MAEWKKFTGSGEQIKEMNETEHGWIVRLINGVETNICYDRVDEVLNRMRIAEYFICEPHPHAEMIKRWADTGQPVYKISEYDNEWQLIAKPHWHRDTKYSFNPPKEKKFIEVRDYLVKTSNGEIFKATANKKFNNIKYIDDMNNFVRWLDDDWRKVEI